MMMMVMMMMMVVILMMMVLSLSLCFPPARCMEGGVIGWADETTAGGADRRG